MAEIKQSALQKLSAGYDGLAERERKIIFFAAPLLVLFVGYILIVEPQILEIDKVAKKQQNIEGQFATLEATKLELFHQMSLDPDEETKLNIQQIQQRLDTLEKQFDKELGQLVSPQVMPLVLEQLFYKAKSLKLIEMQSIAPTALFTDKSNGDTLFQHGIRITFEGGYLDTRDFLTNAENLGWKLYWRHLEYKVSEHPKAITQLEVFTLSTSEAFIGVN
ncbi:MSHA biogenesis protein MshJ [Glaciecola sp. 1036]|uniref:MSHA biogenesis protein MshJ n=1 Tax=Alteromonadaceae TaxID=72275 RepID=UPI003CFBC564